jgi:hypothetical protein
MNPNEKEAHMPLIHASDRAMRQWLAHHKSQESKKMKT